MGRNASKSSRRRHRRAKSKGVRARHCQAIRSLERAAGIGQLTNRKHVDLHAMRKGEAEYALRQALLEALFSAKGHVLVNHGNGTGALRSFVRGVGADICFDVTGARGLVAPYFEDPSGWSIIRFPMEATKRIKGLRLIPPPAFPEDHPYLDLRELYFPVARLQLKARLSQIARRGETSLLVLLGIPRTSNAEFANAAIRASLKKIVRECLGRKASTKEHLRGWIEIQLGEPIS